MRRGAWPGLGALLFLIGCNGGLAAPVSRTQPPVPQGPAPAPSALERQMHGLVNQRRTGRSLPALGWDDRVAAVAREHSQAMGVGGRPFGHDGFDRRAKQLAGILPMRSMAENVAYDSRDGADLASHVVEGWISSSGHRQNIDGDFTVTGIGAARGQDGMWYFTQIFVKTAN